MDCNMISGGKLYWKKQVLVQMEEVGRFLVAKSKIWGVRSGPSMPSHLWLRWCQEIYDRELLVIAYQWLGMNLQMTPLVYFSHVHTLQPQLFVFLIASSAMLSL